MYTLNIIYRHYCAKSDVNAVLFVLLVKRNTETNRIMTERLHT